MRKTGSILTLLTLAMGACLVVLAPATTHAETDEVRLSAELQPVMQGSPATGTARFKMNTGVRRRLRVAVYQVPRDFQAEVRINGVAVGMMDIVGGRGLLDLDTFDGEMVPRIVPGDRIGVMEDGNARLMGTFN